MLLACLQQHMYISHNNHGMSEYAFLLVVTLYTVQAKQLLKSVYNITQITLTYTTSCRYYVVIGQTLSRVARPCSQQQFPFCDENNH